ncbi:MAG: cytochrome c oxidase subunit 3 [Candidatus Pacebacteria bacterium]|nr:cytochrome c oxidase subunit 3 [Candidatus Paceibacterota bacterium]
MAKSNSEHSQDHPFHLVDPSPWPIVTAFSLGIFAWGALRFMHQEGMLLMLVGLAFVLASMAVWFRDVLREGKHHHNPIVQIGLRYGMTLFIASEVMFFAAFFWAFFDNALFPREAINFVWPPAGIETLDPWHLPFLNTLILLLSGTTLTWAHHALIEGDNKNVINGLALTVALGVIFTLVQAWEYSHAAFGLKDTVYASTFYLATGFHGFHVIVGTIFLAVNLVRAKRGTLSEKHHIGFESAAWYWHFVDVIWLFLFICIYWWGGVSAAAE